MPATTLPLDAAPSVRGPRPAVVVGVSGTDASRRAVEYAARSARSVASLLLVSAVGRRSTHRTHAELTLRDALRDDAYLLDEQTMFDDAQREAREIAYNAGAVHVLSMMRFGHPYPVLVGAARQMQAHAIVMGCDTGPTRLVRRLSATAGFTVVAVNPAADAAFSLSPGSRLGRSGWPWRTSTAPAPG
ncbi:universal stress protein [Gordonia sp. CPCC 205515]|uniref:universal stress protein n=1 Tax=Gordonia sp. CPCC 205515 TaxID=3140791 RepID=UPI003AF376DF